MHDYRCGYISEPGRAAVERIEADGNIVKTAVYHQRPVPDADDPAGGIAIKGAVADGNIISSSVILQSAGANTNIMDKGRVSEAGLVAKVSSAVIYLTGENIIIP